MNPIVFYAFLKIIQYTLKCIFPDYYLGGNLEETNVNNVYPQTAMALCNLWGYWIIFTGFKKLTKNKNMWYLLILVVLFAIHSVFEIGGSKSTFKILSALMKDTDNLLAFFVYFVALNRWPKLTRKCLFTIIPLSILHSIYLFNVQMDYAEMMGYGGEIDSNYGAAIAGAIVYPLLFKDNKWALYSYCLMFLFVVYCGQRSGILNVALSLPVAYYSFKNLFKKANVTLVFIIGAVIAVPVGITAYNNLMKRMQRESESGVYGSGRSEFYPIVLESYLSGTTAQKLLGRPMKDMTDVLEQQYGMAITAHNGWLNMIYEYGLLGLVLYLLVFLMIFLDRKHIKKYDKQHYYLYLYTLFAMIVKNTVTHGSFITSYCTIWAIMFFIANYNRKNVEKSVSNEKARIHSSGTYQPATN